MTSCKDTQRRRAWLYGLACFLCISATSNPAAAQVTWKRVGTVSTLDANQLCKTDGQVITCDTTTPTISSSGQVGIGTTSPTQLVTIGSGNMIFPSGMSDISGNLFFGGDTSLSNNGMRFFETGGIGYIDAHSSLNVRVDSGGASTSRLYINSAGLVGIGTTAPSNNLDVSGGVAIGTQYIGVTTAPTSGLLVQGNVGIGTASPNFSLQVIGTTIIGNVQSNPIGYSFASNGLSGFNGGFDVMSAGLFSGHRGTFRFNDTTGNLNYTSTGGTQQHITFNQVGNVGIGTTAPSNKLDISGGVAIGTQYVGVTTAPTSGLLVQGNVGIGTTNPTYSLDLYGADPNIKLYATTNSRYLTLDPGNGNIDENGGATLYLNRYASSVVNIASGGGNVFLVSGGGNVGIGTTAPSNKLDVSGGVAIGTQYVGVTTAPTSGLLVQGNVGIGTTSPYVSLDLHSKTDALALPVGTTGQEPATPLNGMIRYNTSLTDIEAYIGGYWTTLTTGPGGTSSLYLGTSALVPDLAASATDTQTGFYTAGGGHVDVTSQGTQVVDISTAGMNVVSGKVGIGTTNPQGMLDVEGGTASASTSGSGINLIAQNGGSGTANGGNIFIVPGAKSGSGTSGYVTIGTTTSLNYALGIVGQTYIAGNPLYFDANEGIAESGAHGTGFFMNNSTSAYVRVNSNYAIFANGSSEVMIGTSTTPMNTLDVNGGAAIGASYAGVNAAPSNGLIVQGNVGIGTVTPYVSLDLHSKTDALALPVGTTGQEPATPPNGMIRYNTSLTDIEAYIGGYWTTLTTGSGGTSSIYLGTSALVPDLAASATDTQTGFYTAGTGKVDVTSKGTQIVDISTSGMNVVTGNVGIGTTLPGASLNVASSSFVNTILQRSVADSGSAIEFLNGAGNYWVTGVDAGSNNNNFVLRYNNSTATGQKLTVTTGGLIGIGTTAPSNTLDVNGGVAIGTQYVGVTTAPTSGLLVQGNVGIGTTTVPTGPTVAINGSVQVAGSGSEPCNAATVGQMRYNPTGQYMEICTYP